MKNAITVLLAVLLLAFVAAAEGGQQLIGSGTTTGTHDGKAAEFTEWFMDAPVPE